MKKFFAILMVLVLCLAVFAACKKEEVVYDLASAKALVHDDMKDRNEEQGADFEVFTSVMVANVKYEVEWKVNPAEAATVKKLDGNKTLIDINEKTAEAYEFTLTGTVKAGDGTSIDTVAYKFKVPAYVLLTYEEYMAKNTGDSVTIQGIVTGIASKDSGAKYNQIYVQDATGKGGYYIYSMTKDPVKDLKLKVGMTVSVTGTKENYQTPVTHEIKDAVVTVIDTNVSTVTPIDITDAVKALSKLSDSAVWDAYQNALVTIKGVEVAGQDTSNLDNNGYLNFKIGNIETYYRVGGSSLMFPKDQQATIIADHAAHRGWEADVTGIVALYSGNFYLSAVEIGGYTYTKEIVKTPADKITESLVELAFEKVDKNTTITLPAKGVYDDVTYAWALTENAVATLENGVLTITLGENKTTLTLTVTATCGETTETKTFEIAVDAAATDLFVPESVKTPAADTAYKFAFYQAKLGKYFYFAGGMTGGKYLTTTENVASAVDVYMEALGDGILLYFMDGETKTYITIVDGKAALVTTAPTVPFVKGADDLVWNMTVGTEKYYLGTYSTYNTISASKTSYVKADNIYTSQFPAELSTLSLGKLVAESVKTPAADTAYKFAFYQAKLGKYFYFAGGMTGGKYLTTTENAASAVDVYMEALGDGILLYFMDGETKTYITIVDGKAALVTTAPTVPFVKGEDDLVWNMTVGTEKYYLGTYNTYNTISASKTSYVKADNIYTSQFPAELSNVVFYTAPAEEDPGEGGGETGGETPSATASISFADKANRTEFTTEIQVWAQNGITVTNNQGESTSPVADYAKPARFYKNSSLTVAYTGMTKVVVHCNSEKYATDFAKVTIEGATITASGKDVTIVFASAVNTFTTVLTGGQVRVDSIDVYA